MCRLLGYPASPASLHSESLLLFSVSYCRQAQLRLFGAAYLRHKHYRACWTCPTCKHSGVHDENLFKGDGTKLEILESGSYVWEMTTLLLLRR